MKSNFVLVSPAMLEPETLFTGFDRASSKPVIAMTCVDVKPRRGKRRAEIAKSVVSRGV